MQYRKLGNTDIEVSEVGFGAWQLGNKGWNGSQDKEAKDLVKKALELGVNFFDTAPGYGDGESQRILGEVLSPVRDDIVIVTKFGHNPGGISDFSIEALRPSIENSLKALQTDYIDGVLLHNPPMDVLSGKEGHYKVLEELKDEGLIKAYGASIDSSNELNILMDNSDSQIAEIYFHALHQEMAVVFNRAKQRGLGLIVKVPLDSGWLTGKYTKDTIFKTGFRERWTEEVKERRYNYVKQLSFLQKSDQTMAQGALRFLLGFTELSTVIPGSKNINQLIDNISASEGRLNISDIDQIKELWNKQIKKSPLPW